MGFLQEELVDLLIGKGDEKASNKVKEIFDERKFAKFCEDMPEVIEKRVLYPVESETYFKDFHSFCMSNKVVARLVTSLVSTSGESSVSLINKFSEDFIAQYPKHSMSRKRVKELLEKIADTIQLEIKSRGLFAEEKEIVLFNAQKSKEIAETQHKIKASVDSLGNQMQEARKSLSKIEKHFENESDKNISSVLSIGQLTDDTEYAVEVKRIETDIQQKLHFKEAIVKYNELITDIRESVKNSNELLTHIYINLALCYANDEEYTRANKSLEYAKKYCDWEKNAKYHYVKGYICWKEDENNISAAIEFLDQAICLDPKHIHAKMLRCQLGAFRGEEKVTIISMLSEVETEISKIDDRADLYQTKGLIYKAYGEYDPAEEWMLKAEQEQHSIGNLINLGILYYSRATVNNEHGKRLLKVKINYPDIFKAFECFQRVMQEISQEEFDLYKRVFIEVYITTCVLCERPEQIENIQIPAEDRDSLEYETQRSLIYHETIKGKTVDVDLLSDEDKLFLSYVEKAENGETEEAFRLIMESIYNDEGSDLERKYNFAIQLAIELKRVDDFRKLRKNIQKEKVECPYLDLYDAEYYDIIGEPEKSKAYYDSHIQENDGLCLLNAILFYKKNSYDSELMQAYCIVLEKVGNKEIAIHRPENIIQDAFLYLADHDMDLAIDMLERFDYNVINPDTFKRISKMVYSRVMNVQKLLDIYESGEEEQKTFEQKSNYLIILKYNLQFEKAKEEAEKMLSSYHKESKDWQIKYLELLSELCLFVGDLDKSAEYITMAKDLAQELVYDPVHQLYMTRMMRCGKEDGLSYGIEFKQMHPNVVDWLKQFQAIEKNEQGEKKLTDEFVDILEKQKERFDMCLSYYKNETITFYQLQKLLGSDLLAMLSIPDCDRVKFVIGLGNIKQIYEQGKKIRDKVVIDVMTLLFIKYYDILEILDGFSVIYITYSSVEELEKIFIQHGTKLVDDLITWLRNDLRVELYPNYSRLREEEASYHPEYFMDSLEAAKRENCSFLCIDARVPLYFCEDANYFINIMSLVHREEEKKSSIFVTKLLAHNVTFINFRADDIIDSLENEIDETIITKFFAIEPCCDSDSFINVYHMAICKLCSSGNEEKMERYLSFICKQIDRTYSRARMCRWRFEEYKNMEEDEKYIYYVRHNILLLFMLNDALENSEELWNKICSYPYKYFDTSILENIRKSTEKNENVNRREVAEELVGYYAFPIE